MIRFFGCALVGTALLAGIGCKGGAASGSSNVVATVNGTPIDQDEFLRYTMLKPTIRVVPSATPGTTTMRVAETIGFQALDDLVRQKLLKQLAMNEGAWPSSSEVAAELAFREKRQPNFVREAGERGLSLEMIREVLALELAQHKLITKGIQISDQEVDAYIKENPERFRSPATVDLLWIMARGDDAKNQADEELRRGQMFQVVAERFSEARGARRDRGRFPIRTVDEMPVQLKDIINKTQELRATDWVRLQDGWAKFYVEKKTPAKPIPIDDFVKEMVRRDLAGRRGRMANDLEARLMKLMREADIQIKLKGLERSWKRYMDTVRDTVPATPDATGQPEAAPKAEDKAETKTGG